MCFAMKIITLALVLLWTRPSRTILIACPDVSVCVPKTNCETDDIVFDVHHSPEEHKRYVCGVLEETEGKVCCANPHGLSSTEDGGGAWHYPAEEEEGFAGVISYSQLMSLAEDPRCPEHSYCIHRLMCPHNEVMFDFWTNDNKTKNFTCGSEEKGQVCCLRTVHLPVNSFSSETNLDCQNTGSLSDGTCEASGHSLTKRSVAFLNSDTAYTPRQHLLEALILTNATSKAHAPIPQNWRCGEQLSFPQRNGRIYAPFGDSLAREGEYPWQVAVLTRERTYLCSGVLVDDLTVVTAGKCVHQRSPFSLLVRVGDLDLSSTKEKHTAYDVEVIKLAVHPKFELHYLHYDLGVLRLKVSVRILENVRPACLPWKVTPDLNNCRVSGWGQTRQSIHDLPDFSYHLRHASFFVVNRKDCQDSLRTVKELGSFFKLQESAMCAKGFSNADTCKGDGGSGLVCASSAGFVLKGIVSYGFGCGLNLPGVYTDVEKVSQFITSFIEDTVALPEDHYTGHFPSKPIETAVPPYRPPSSGRPLTPLENLQIYVPQLSQAGAVKPEVSYPYQIGHPTYSTNPSSPPYPTTAPPHRPDNHGPLVKPGSESYNHGPLVKPGSESYNYGPYTVKPGSDSYGGAVHIIRPTSDEYGKDRFTIKPHENFGHHDSPYIVRPGSGHGQYDADNHNVYYGSAHQPSGTYEGPYIVTQTNDYPTYQGPNYASDYFYSPSSKRDYFKIKYPLSYDKQGYLHNGFQRPLSTKRDYDEYRLWNL